MVCPIMGRKIKDGSMSDDFRRQVYNSLILKETDELLEIWEKNDRTDWSEFAFESIREILLERLGEVPPQNEPVYEHVAQEMEDDDLSEISPEDEALYLYDEENAVKIEFEGFYGKRTLRQKATLQATLSQQQVIWRRI